jgi:phosphate-selective porin OprO and OprP
VGFSLLALVSLFFLQPPAGEDAPPPDPGVTSVSQAGFDAQDPAPAESVSLVAPDPVEPALVAEPEPAPAVPEPEIVAPEQSVSPLIPAKEIERMRPRPIGAAVWKPTSGLRIQTADNLFALTFRMRVQLRYELQHDNEANQTRNAFMVRRARLQFRGHIFGQHNKYYLQIAISPNDMGWTSDGPSFTPIRNWELSFDYLRDLTITIGQMKVNYNRQRVISSGDLQTPDRSTVTAEFTLDRDVGLKIHSDDLGGIGYLRYSLGIFNGEGRDGYRVDDMGLLYVGRIELIPTGDADGNWGDDEVDWARSRRPSLVIAGAYAYHDRAKRSRGSLGSRPLDLGTTDFHQAQADLMLKVAGFVLNSEFQWRKGIREFGDGTVIDSMGMEVAAPRVPARNGLGYYVQPGFLIPHLPVELIGHWGQIIGLGETSLPDSEAVGGGISWYIARHSLKLQADYLRLRTDSYDVETASFAHQPWSRSTDQLRVQLQIAF